MAGSVGNPNWKKGQSGNPKGRSPILLPEVQTLIEKNRNAFKTAIIEQVEPKIAEWIARVIDQGIGEGDVVRLKVLLELALGKMVDDAPEFPLTEEEKLLVLAWRHRKKESDEPRTASGNELVPRGTQEENSEA